MFGSVLGQSYYQTLRCWFRFDFAEAKFPIHLHDLTGDVADVVEASKFQGLEVRGKSTVHLQTICAR